VMTVVTSAAAFSMFAALWYVLPLRRVFKYRAEGLRRVDPPADPPAAPPAQ
jgi:hypothetical protein